jgi:hypothetical protein
MAIVSLATAVSLQFEAELRAAGVERSAADAVADTVRRVPRTLIWSLAAGSARLQGELEVRLGLATLPEPRLGANDDSNPSRPCRTA